VPLRPEEEFWRDELHIFHIFTKKNTKLSIKNNKPKNNMNVIFLNLAFLHPDVLAGKGSKSRKHPSDSSIIQQLSFAQNSIPPSPHFMVGNTAGL